MTKINQELLLKIKNYINECYIQNSRTPTVREIARELNVSTATAHRYVTLLKEIGEINYDSGWKRMITTEMINKVNDEMNMVGLVGSVSCGPLTFAEQNIVEYFKLPSALIGHGDFFVLRAKGKSMIKAGIDDGDYVVIKRQNTAEDGQIVVALDGDEATLKRFYRDEKNKKVRLHPENDRMKDIILDDVQIQGIAVNVFKKLS
ncbi:MAG: transcriptional repressor LexA [Clostridiales bacterium]|nr:transcriptional repressor LexA [Clostridiales bacterium]